MTNQTIAPPPAKLLRSGHAAPDTQTVLAEVRSDASLPFDPAAAPDYLKITGESFGALVTWHVDLSWTDAQKLQLWLTDAPDGGAFLTREEALRDFFDTLEAGDPPEPFITYVGTYLATSVSHASYTVLLGMRVPFTRDQYQASFLDALKKLLATGGPGGWYDELMTFLRLMLNQPSSREEFPTLASNVGSLLQATGGQQNYPLITLLLT